MLTVRKIKQEEFVEFVAFLRKIAEWLIETNKGMWDINRLEIGKFKKNNRYDECYFGFVNKVPVASMILKEQDYFMWQKARNNEAIYIGKLGVAREYSGKGYANKMLEYALTEAKRRDKQFLRLDCYADRKYLCKLYEDFGFNLIEKREMKQGLYAALYELKV